MAMSRVERKEYNKKWYGKNKEKVILKSRWTELAYLAGLIDGEGSIFVARSGDKLHCLIVAVANTNKLILEYCQNVFQVGHINKNKRRNPQHKDAWVWKTTGNGAKKVLRYVYPFLRIKEPQAKLALMYPVHKTTKAFTEEEKQKQLIVYEALKILNKRGN